MILVAEDQLCQAVMTRLLVHADRRFEIIKSIVERGVSKVRLSVHKYRQASRSIPHVVLVDLDQAACPVALLRDWGLIPTEPALLFRVAVREVEAWLLADAEGLSRFISVPRNRVPMQPESLPDPKQTLVNLARRSKTKLKQELVPPTGSRVPIGPLYNERMALFVRDHWNVEAALLAAPSLKRAVHRLQNFIG